MMLIIDAADPVAGEHDPVFLLRVGAALGQRHLPVQKTVVHGGRALQGHHVRPPLHHPLVLAEKAVPADVHPIFPVADGFGNAADLLTALQHGHVVFAGFQKLVGGGQSCGARADDEHFFHVRIPRFVIRWQKMKKTGSLFLKRMIRRGKTYQASTSWPVSVTST